jgi:hypothetical protein
MGTSLEGAMDTVLERIAAWEAAGLIDRQTADRLRAAESSPAPSPLGSPQPSSVGSAAGSFFGPTPTIVEMFGYLGALFLIAAWSAFLVRIAGSAGDHDRATILAFGTALGAAILLGVGLMFRAGDARRRRAGGVAILAATLAAASAGGFAGAALSLDVPVSAVVSAAAALLVAAIGRIALPAVTTQGAVLLAATGLAWATFRLLEPASLECCDSVQPRADVIRLVVVPAIGWLALAVVFGALGLVEARSSGAPAQRRAGLTRFWAGLVAVAGVATSVFASGSLGAGDYGRLIEPWIAEVAIIAVSLVLVERAFRRDSSAYILAAAIGLVTALTDFNFRYLTNSTDVALLVEGVILIGAGVAADRLRRRIERSRSAPPGEPPPADSLPAASVP